MPSSERTDMSMCGSLSQIGRLRCTGLDNLTEMAELNRAVAALRIVGDDLTPDEVTSLLRVPPTRSFARGDEVRHRRTPARIASFGLWILDAPETEPADLDRQVSELLAPLPSDLGIWRGLASRFNVELFCGWFMKFGNEGLTVAPGTLNALGERQIVLDLDIYAGDSEARTGVDGLTR